MHTICMGCQYFSSDGAMRPLHTILTTSPRVVAYTGTHDNDTFAGWYSKIGSDDRRRVRKSLGCNSEDVPKEAVKRLISSKADIVVIPLQDVLGLGSSARINTPWTCQQEKLVMDGTLTLGIP